VLVNRLPDGSCRGSVKAAELIAKSLVEIVDLQSTDIGASEVWGR